MLDTILRFLNTALLVAILGALVEINYRMPTVPPTNEEFEAAKNDMRKQAALEKRIPRVAIHGPVSVENRLSTEGLEVYIPNAVEVRTDSRDPLYIRTEVGGQGLKIDDQKPVEVHITRDE